LPARLRDHRGWRRPRCAPRTPTPGPALPARCSRSTSAWPAPALTA